MSKRIRLGPEYTTRQLAKTILDIEAPSECQGMPYRAEDYAKILDVSKRTVGRSLAVLVKAGAVKLLRRGPAPPVLEITDLNRLCAAIDGKLEDVSKTSPREQDAPGVEALAVAVGTLARAVRALADDVLRLRLQLEESGPLSCQFRRRPRRRGQRRAARMLGGSEAVRRLA